MTCAVECRTGRRSTYDCGATLDEVSVMVQTLTGDLRAAGCAPIMAEIEISLVEVLTNVVEHAYQMDPAGWIRVKITQQKSGLKIAVFDGGRAMPNEALLDSGMPSLDVAACDLPEGGFGWPLIRQLASSVKHARRRGINRLQLAFDLPAAAT